MTRRALIIFGTRPEAIKVAPVIHAMRANPDFDAIIAVTAQHREMLDQVLNLFELHPQYDLDIMVQGQTLTDITAKAIRGLTPVIRKASPEFVMVQGDTTTTFAGALAAFYANVPVVHLEAGYRTGDRRLPFPEEMNRRLVSELAEWHLASNDTCRANLLGEGHSEHSIAVVGNTGIDALKHALRFGGEPPDAAIRTILAAKSRIVLMTMHRRENWGRHIEAACQAARCLVESRADVEVLFAAHLNPEVQAVARNVLEGARRVHLLSALDFLSFSRALEAAELVMSDSGGVHEESVALGKPLLMLRTVTEWPEAVASGQVRLVGTEATRIASEANAVLDALEAGVRLPVYHNPLADGYAAHRAVDFLAGLS